MSIPLVTVSDLLKQAGFNTSSGKLIDDETVSRVLALNLLGKPPYLLDGFPRTAAQVELMEETWPKNLRVEAAVSLDVPRQVCLEKLHGRRICPKCKRNWNVADVKHGKFILPPSLPPPPPTDAAGNGCCCVRTEFVQREDDTQTGVIEKRLDIFYKTTEPILNHYEAKGRLFRFAPYRGYDDMPRFEAELKDWLGNMDSGGAMKSRSKL